MKEERFTIRKQGFPVKPEQEPPRSISGFVNGREVITLSNHIMGKWHVGSSICLPSDLEQAKEILECFVKVFEELENNK